MRGQKRGALWISVTASLMAMTIVLSSFSIPVPGGHLYLCDVAICLGALLLDPVGAFIVGGIGSFIGDAIFYPPSMFVSLITHGIQAVAISLLSRHLFKNKPLLSGIFAVFVGAVIMIIGYTLGRTFIYSTWEYAAIKLPFEILQATVGGALGVILCYKFNIKKQFDKIMSKRE